MNERLDMDNVLKDWAESLIGRIRGNMESEGVNATGGTSRSLESRITDDGVEVLAAPFFAERTEIGSTPWSRGFPGRGFQESIKEWIEAKGIAASLGVGEGGKGSRTLDDAAWATAVRIAKSGSSKYRDASKRTDVFSTVTDEAVKDLMERMAVAMAQRAGGVLDDAIRGAGERVPVITI